MEASNPTGSGSRDATQPPSLPLAHPLANAHLLPSLDHSPKLAMFQKIVLAIEKSNAMKKQLNAYQHRHRIDPGKIEVVSDDEPEDEMPNMAEFLDLPSTPAAKDSDLPLLSSSLPAAPVSTNPPMDQLMSEGGIQGHLNRANILANPSLLPAMANPAGPIANLAVLKCSQIGTLWGQLSMMLRQR